MTPLRAIAAQVFVSTAASFLLAEPPAKTLDDVRVFAVYEPVFTRQDVELLSRVQPDFVCRGWFKWHHTPDWQTYAPLAQACREKGILLQGGITLAALYPGENGMDDATFRDFACHGTDGTPFLCTHFSAGEGWYHLSLYNPKVIDYLKRQVRLQIDAGAVGIWYDEIEGYYDWNPTEGYDPYACAAFRDWLIRKFCAGQGWREDDPRWRERFGIDLAKHGGSIRTFDYLRHLRTTPGKDGKPLAANPPQGHPRGWASSPNPLFREWGYAWDRKARGTFRFDTVAALFADLLADADRYAREKFGRTPLSTYNHNGTARPGVAFQQPHNGAQPPLWKGRLDGRISYLSYYEDLIADAAEVCPGQPVVFFVDWPGETDRLTALPRADQTHFFSLYIPEAYAAGGEFALPLRGYSYAAANQDTLAQLARLADFYRAHAPWLRGSRPLPHQPQSADRLTVRARTSAAGTAVHIVNHAFSARDVWPLPRTNLVVALGWDGPAPAAAFAVSPDFPEQRPVPLTLKEGQLSLEVGTVTCSALVLLPNAGRLRPVSGTAATGTHILDPQGRALSIARDNRFTLWLPPEGRDGPPDRPITLECLETGERLPARDGAAFAAPPPGDFASGLLLDAFGIPARHAEIASGARRWRTDAWGRFRIPLSLAANGQASACVEPGATHALALGAGFTAWRCVAPRTPILAFENQACERAGEPASATASAAVEGFWANWPDKERVSGVIALTREAHVGATALRCAFASGPAVPWSNVNSPPFQLGNAEGVELDYAGDGSARAVDAVLYAPQLRDRPAFFRCPLPLDDTAWRRRRLAFAEFRNDRGEPFDPAAVKGAMCFQLAPSGGSRSAPAAATLWLRCVALVSGTPVRELWRSDEPFDAVDVDRLRAEHLLPPPTPEVASREPLVALDGPLPRLFANWEGKGGADAKPMVTVERVAPLGQPPFLRVTLPAGACAWGNANVTLPAAMLRDCDGLALRLRASAASGAVSLALHAMPKGGERGFYSTDVDVGEAWTDVTLPWRDFTRDDGRPFAPEAGTAVDLQICRPARTLVRDLAVSLERIDGFKTKE
jgi:hypothetical protein